MKTRPLCSHGPRVSEIGLRYDDEGSGEGGPAAIERTAREAASGGINFLHTDLTHGPVGGGGPTGNGLGGRFPAPVIAASVPAAAGPQPPSPYCRWQDRYPAPHLRDWIDAGLRSLAADQLGLLQLDDWSRGWNDDPQPLLVLRRLREEGKLCLIGVRAPEGDPNAVVQLMRDGLVDVVQAAFSLFDQEAAAQLLPVAAETGTGVVIQMPDETHWQPAGSAFGQITDDIARFGLAEHYSPRDVAVKFVLARPEVSSLVAEMRTPREVRDLVRAAGLPDLPEAMATHLRRYHRPPAAAFRGPA